MGSSSLNTIVYYVFGLQLMAALFTGNMPFIPASQIPLSIEYRIVLPPVTVTQ